jgi:hypothetical protein
MPLEVFDFTIKVSEHIVMVHVEGRLAIARGSERNMEFLIGMQTWQLRP